MKKAYLGFLLLFLVGIAYGATVKIVPPSKNTYLGEEFDLHVEIENVEDLYGYDLALDFDDTKFEIVSESWGNFLSQNGTYVHNTFLPASKTFRAVRTEVQTGVNGSGTLFTVRLRTNFSSGRETISIVNPQFANSVPQDIDVDTQGATITSYAERLVLQAGSESDDRTVYTVEPMKFNATLIDVTTGLRVSTAACTISIPSFNIDTQMTYNSSAQVYEYSNSFDQAGTYGYNVSCTNGTTRVQTSGSFTIEQNPCDSDVDGYISDEGTCDSYATPGEERDCNDNDASINPGANEDCYNPEDEDCDGFFNYDGLGAGTHGDSDCLVTVDDLESSVTEIRQTFPFEVNCTYNQPITKVATGMAVVIGEETILCDGLNLHNKTIKFKCYGGFNVTTSLPISKTIVCAVNTSIAYQSGNNITQTISVSPYNPGDVNYDKIVNILDLVIVGKAYTSQEDDPRYDIRADFYVEGRGRDGQITIVDLTAVATYWGIQY